MKDAEVPGEVSTCVSCGETLAGRFCSACGEERIGAHDHSLGHFAAHSLHDLAHFDTRIFRTVKLLLTQPGNLTAEYFVGRRKRYLSPVQLFVMINILFFFLLPRFGLFRLSYDYYQQNGRIFGSAVPVQPLLDSARGAAPVEEYRREFDSEIDHTKKVFIIFMALVFALLLFLLEARSGKSFLEHLVFSLHFYAFWMILMMVIPALLYWGLVLWGKILVLRGNAHPHFSFGDLVLIPLMIALSAVYLYPALRRFYGDGKVGASVRSVLLGIALVFVFVLYRDVLFLLTLFLTRGQGAQT